MTIGGITLVVENRSCARPIATGNSSQAQEISEDMLAQHGQGRQEKTILPAIGREAGLPHVDSWFPTPASRDIDTTSCHKCV
jgi:hypothetical protein